MITVVLADDHASVRSGLRLLLDTASDIQVTGEASDGAQALRLVAEHRPDVVLMDARMPGMDGIAATRQIVDRNHAQVLMLTTFDLDEVVFGALQAGAAGFLLKSVEPAQLLDAIRRVAAGDGVIAPEVTRKLLDTFVTDSDRTSAEVAPSTTVSRRLPDHLTPREVEVLAALGRGLSNAEIAQEFHVSMATVNTHGSNLLMKLRASSRMQAAIFAREAGLA